MDNFTTIQNFPACLQRYFEENPERLPSGIDIAKLQVMPFQSAWTNIDLAESHEYTRTMDVKFVEVNTYKAARLYSYQIRYSPAQKVIEATMINLP